MRRTALLPSARLLSLPPHIEGYTLPRVSFLSGRPSIILPPIHCQEALSPLNSVSSVSAIVSPPSRQRHEKFSSWPATDLSFEVLHVSDMSFSTGPGTLDRLMSLAFNGLFSSGPDRRPYTQPFKKERSILHI
ncbi:hypothetical protein M752DRAFT_92258 [Aspergillus phoenicis ATCC 13157]|uniref:Uncharacterized protein n=1 Tax=Aspergillus phoenicis ATCC 13157 TaxID=1353007 RepID=A0A370P6G2_ASPPH|nr:hypothetical protein M752DRAFT_92258 [Aspergillus phoenicis ATCC 13157]